MRSTAFSATITIGGIGIAADETRKDRSVGYPQGRHAPYAQFGVDDRGGVLAHAAGAAPDDARSLAARRT